MKEQRQTANKGGGVRGDDARRVLVERLKEWPGVLADIWRRTHSDYFEHELLRMEGRVQFAASIGAIEHWEKDRAIEWLNAHVDLAKRNLTVMWWDEERP